MRNPFRSLGLLLSCCTLGFSLPVQADTSFLPPRIDKAMQTNKIPGSDLSLVMLPLDGPGENDYYNADVSVNPASTMKLITTFAALELLGPTYQWKTEFYTDGTLKDGILNGNLYLKGGGDPKLNMERLWLLMRDLRANGVLEVTGDLVLDRSRFVKPDLPAFNDDGEDENKTFLVGPDSLLVNLKSVRMVVRSADGRVSVSMDPPLTNVNIDNQMRATGKSGCPAWPDVRFNPVPQADGSTSLVVSGQLPDGCNAQSYLSLLDHPAYTAGAVRAIWQELGGSIKGRTREGSVPRNAEVLARAFSPDVVEIIRDINKYSNNTMAQQLFLSIGAQFRTSADADDSKAALRVIRSWLARKGINASHLIMENGSGLSRTERVSAREMAEILRAAWQSPYGPEFISSLPLAGMDGTLRKRMKNSPLTGQAHMKTGTLNNVRALAGFVRDANARNWVVVAILNSSRPWGASSILDEVVLDLYLRSRQDGAVAN